MGKTAFVCDDVHDVDDKMSEKGGKNTHKKTCIGKKTNGPLSLFLHKTKMFCSFHAHMCECMKSW